MATQESIINIKINTDKAQKSLDGTSKSVRDVDRNTRNLKAELKDLKQEMQGLDVGSEQFQKLAQEAGALEDKIGKVNAATKAFSSDTLVLDQTVGVVQGMAGAYGAVQGAMALAGVENEKLLEVMVRLQAIQAVTNGLQSVGVMINKASASGMLIRTTAQRVYNAVLGQTNVATVTNTSVTTAQTVATGGATVATRGLAVAMNALPIMALVTGIGMIVSALFDWGDATDDVADGMDSINDRELRLKKVTEDVNSLLSEQVKLQEEQNRTQITFLENQLKLIGLKKEKSEDDLQNEANIKQQIIKLNQDILKQEEVLLSTSIKLIQRQQQDAQRALNEIFINLDNLEEKLEQTFSNNALKVVKSEIEEFKALSKPLIESLNAEMDIRKELSELKLSDFENEQKFNSKVIQLNDNLAKQISISEQRLSKIKAKQNDFRLNNFDFNIEEQIKIIENYNNKSVQLDEKNLANKLKFQKVVTKGVELYNQNLLIIEQERLRKEGKLRDDEKERRKKSLDELLYGEKRLADATTKIRELTSQRFLKGLDGEVEKLNESYNKERQDIINKATQRELKANEQKFLNLEISEQQFFARRGQIVDAGINNLISEEQNYLDAYRNYTDERIQLTIKEHKQRENLTKEQTKVLLAEQVKLSTQQTMLQAESDALLQAQAEVGNRKWYQSQLDVEEIFQENMRKVKSDFLMQQMNDEKELLNAKIDLLEVEKQQALDNEELTQIERTKITQEYALKRQQLEADASQTIANLNSELNETLQTNSELGWLKTYAAIQLVAQQTMALGNEIAKSFQIATQNAIGSINSMYSSQAEEFNKQLVNQEISQEEHDDKMMLLEKNKQAEIRALNMAQFERDKKNNVAQAAMSGAMAGAQAFVNPGFPLVFGILPLIAAQTAMAISNIRSQQFTANRGGIVPGDSTVNKDSVNAFLTPGEAVMTKSATDMFLPLLSTMNQIGGGKSLDGSPLQSQPTSKEKGNTVIKTYVTTKDLRKGLDTDKRGRLNSRF